MSATFPPVPPHEPVIKFERFVKDCAWNNTAHKRHKPEFIYDWRIMVNDEHVATFERQGDRRLYILVDLDGNDIERKLASGTRVQFKARSREDFTHVFLDAKGRGLVPTRFQLDAAFTALREEMQATRDHRKAQQQLTDDTARFIDKVAALNADAGEIGAGMLANLVAEAKRLQALGVVIKAAA
jgi:hypothetical protein